MSEIDAADKLMNATFCALNQGGKTPKSDPSRFSAFSRNNTDGQNAFIATYRSVCRVCGEVYDFEVSVYQNYGVVEGKPWSEGWFFAIDGERHIFDNHVFHSAQAAADALVVELMDHDYHHHD